MERRILLSLSLIVVVALTAMIGCGESGDITRPQNNIPEITIGQVHTEVLQQIYSDLDMTRAAKGQLSRADEDEIVIQSINEITDRYGVPQMKPEEILAEVERGREMAQKDPVKLISNLLSPKEQEWWDRFAQEAEVGNAREVYERHCQLYGTPEYNTMLGRILDVALSSAEFWDTYRADQVPSYHNPYLPQTAAKSWKKFLRFCVNVVVDGTAGGLAGTGATVVSGPVAGTIAGGIVGGLASHGADDILFN